MKIVFAYQENLKNIKKSFQIKNSKRLHNHREWLNRYKIIDYKHAYRLIFEYIETFYNTVRIHSHCDYTSLNDYERKYENELKELERKAS